MIGYDRYSHQCTALTRHLTLSMRISPKAKTDAASKALIAVQPTQHPQIQTQTKRVSSAAFVDCDCYCESVKSTWRTRKACSDASTQTVPVQYDDTASQVSETAEQEAQYDKFDIASEDSMKRAQQVCSAFVDPDVPAPLREFLSQALPLIESALQCNSASTAFESYYAQHTLKHETAQLTRTLTVDFVKAGLLQQLSASSILQCTGVSWNATGTTLAVSYGRVDVPGWCDLPGAVCLWNLIGRKFRADRPDIILDHSSCVMCVAWHPLRPAVVAAGCFSGEVVVWDTSLEPETLVACSRIQESYHMTPVMQVRWILDPHAKEILLASIAGDGKVLFWSQRDSFQCPRRGAGIPTGGLQSRAGSKIGGTALAFSKDAIGAVHMYVGTEGGRLMRCAMESVGIRLTPNMREFTAPKMTQYEQHPSSITDLACSPFQPNLFLASCLDGTARLFNVFEARPVLTLEPHASRPSRNDTSAILAAQFSPTRPCILALASDDGTIFIYDLLESETLPIAVIEIPNAAAAEGFVPGMRVSSTGLAFNPQSHGMLASCDLIGRAFVWRLGAKTAQLHGGEQLVLDQLARVQRASQF